MLFCVKDNKDIIWLCFRWHDLIAKIEEHCIIFLERMNQIKATDIVKALIGSPEAFWQLRSLWDLGSYPAKHSLQTA